MNILSRAIPNASARVYRLRRDGQRPLEFYGKPIGVVEVSAWEGQAVTRLAVYETKGKRFVAEFCRRPSEGADPDAPPTGMRVVYRAMVFDRLTDAVGYFGEGRPKDELLSQLGLLDPEFVD